MRRHRRSLIATAVVITMLAAACSGDDDSDESTPDTDEPADEPADEPNDGDEPADADDEPAELEGEGLTLGFIRAPVGLFGILGGAQAGGLALAVADVNAEGGVLGGPLTIAERQPTPDLDVNAVFDELIDEDVTLIVGPSSSEEALMIIPQLVADNAVVCGASTTAPGLPETPEAEGRFVRTTFDDNIVAVNAFERIRKQTAAIIDRPPKVAIVARGDAYGDSVSGALAPLLTLVGMQVTVERYAPEDQLLESTATATAATDPDIVVVISLAEGPRLAKQIVEAGVPADQVLGLDGLTSPRFVGKANITDPADFQNLTVIGATGPVEFLTPLLEEPSSDGEVIYSAQAYDCAISFALAVEAAGSTDATAVSQALRDVTGGGPVCTTYAECVGRLRAGEDINYDGPSGPVDFTPEGEPGGGRILTARLTGDLLRVVEDLRISLDEIRTRVAPRVAGFIGDMQVALTTLGYYTGPIDGQENDEFKAAVAAFQTDNGLEATGELNAPTIAAIQDALAEQGLLLNASIRDVQVLLTELGYYTGPIDGIWSQQLSDAIAAFQNALGVQPTGVLDAATLRAIYQAGFESGGGGTTTTTLAPVITATTIDITPSTTTPATTTPPTTPTTPATTAVATTTTSTTPATTTTTTIPVPPNSLLGVLQANGFTALANLITPAVIQAIPELTDPSAQVTMFAPTNAAIGASPPPTDEAALTELIQYQIVDQMLNPLVDVTGAPTLLAGHTVDVDAATRIVTSEDGTTANLGAPPLAAGAGVVWGIDSVLVPTP